MAKYPLVGPKNVKLEVGERDAEGGKVFKQKISPIFMPEDSELSSLSPASFTDYVETVVKPLFTTFAEAYGGTIEIQDVDAKDMSITYRATGGALEALEENIARAAQSLSQSR